MSGFFSGRGCIAYGERGCISDLESALLIGVKEDARGFCSFCELVGEGFAREGCIAIGIDGDAAG